MRKRLYRGTKPDGLYRIKILDKALKLFDRHGSRAHVLEVGKACELGGLEYTFCDRKSVQTFSSLYIEQVNLSDVLSRRDCLQRYYQTLNSQKHLQRV